MEGRMKLKESEEDEDLDEETEDVEDTDETEETDESSESEESDETEEAEESSDREGDGEETAVAPETDNVGDPSVEINVEELIHEIEAEGEASRPGRELAAKRRLEDLMERKRSKRELEDFDDYEV
jgi:hypothetical protein